MAEELTLNGNIRFSHASSIDTGQYTFANQLKLNLTGYRATRTVQNIGTSKELINLGEISAPGYMLAVNKDPANFVQIYTDNSTGPAFVKLQKNEIALVPLDGGITAPAAKADTAACNVEFWILER